MAVLRGDVVQLLALRVDEPARGRGVGAALYDAVRGFARVRSARALEAAVPVEGDGLGFLLSRRLAVRSVLLLLEAPLPVPPARVPLQPTRMTPGPAFSGWVADLDRETRGFPRTPEWSRWTREGEVWALRSGGRPAAVAALRLHERHAGLALLGPLAARRPELAAAALPFLAGRATVLGASRARLVAPSEGRTLLSAAFASGFRVTGASALLGSRAPRDLRRYAASHGPFA